jgi:hypothetical protein
VRLARGGAFASSGFGAGLAAASCPRLDEAPALASRWLDAPRRIPAMSRAEVSSRPGPGVVEIPISE